MTPPAPITVSEVLPATPVTATDAPLIAVVAPLDYPGLTEETRELVIRFTSSATPQPGSSVCSGTRKTPTGPKLTEKRCSPHSSPA